MSSGKPKDDGHREKLPQEVTFDKAVYGGISYAAQAGTGILLTYWLKYGSGKPYFDKMAKWLGPKLYRSKTIEEATKEISSPLMVTTMIMVGNTFLLPVKWLENRKPQIIRSWHEKSVQDREASGNPMSEEEKAHAEKCLQELEKAPKQTWGSLLGGRAFGLSAVYATLFALGNKRNEAAEAYSAKAILKGLDTIGLKKAAQSKTLERYIHVGFLDVFYSMVSAGGLYVYSHLIRPPKKHINEGLLPDIIPGPTPGTPAINALEYGEKYEDHINLEKHPEKSFAEKVGQRASAPIKPEKKPESYQGKLALESSKETGAALEHHHSH